jgi:hypothetical protein
MGSRLPSVLLVVALAACSSQPDDRAAAAPTAVVPPVAQGEPVAPTEDVAAATEPHAAAAPVVENAPRPIAREPLRIARPAGDAAAEPIRPMATASAAAPATPAAAAPAPVTPEAAPTAVTEDDVRVVQETLQAQGLYLGPLDGTLGDETRHALAAYQRGAGLRETAALDPATMRRLDADQSDHSYSYGGSR